MDFKFQVQTKIVKPVQEVFDAVVNNKKLNAYFTGTATPMEEGGTALWTFRGYPGEYPVHVRKIVPNQLIVLEWSSHEGGYDTHVEISFEPIDARSTMLKISESGWKETPEGLRNSYDNCQGWTHMSMCLKSFLEHGIDLR